MTWPEKEEAAWRLLGTGLHSSAWEGHCVQGRPQPWGQSCCRAVLETRLGTALHKGEQGWGTELEVFPVSSMGPPMANDTAFLLSRVCAGTHITQGFCLQ